MKSSLAVALLLALSTVPASLPAAVASDFRKDFYTAALDLETAARTLGHEAAIHVRGENSVRKRILAEVAEYACRAGQLTEQVADDRTKTEAFHSLGRLNDLAGYLAADLPRSVPFGWMKPLAAKAQSQLDRVNRAAALYFGAFQPDSLAYGYADEVAEKSAGLIGEVRATTGHTGRRHKLVMALEEFAAHARAYAAALGDPLVTEPGRRERLRLLFHHGDIIDLAMSECRANDYVRARWNGIHDSLRMIRSRFDALDRGA